MLIRNSLCIRCLVKGAVVVLNIHTLQAIYLTGLPTETEEIPTKNQNHYL